MAERNPEGSIDVLERHTRTIFLQRRHLLPQSEVLDHKIGAPPTYRSQRTGADRDEEYKNTEHDGVILHSLVRISSGIQVLDFIGRTGFDDGQCCVVGKTVISTRSARLRMPDLNLI